MSQTRIIIGLLIVVVGISALFDIPLLRFIFPLFLIWIGLAIILGRSGFNFEQKSEEREDIIKRVLIFSGINKRFFSDNFRGAEIVAIFGGGEIDLSQVETQEKEVNLDLVAIFGGLKMIVPKNWVVKSEGVGILGGFDDKTSIDGKKDVTARIKGVAIFGGVEVVSVN